MPQSSHTPPNPLTIGFPATQAQTHTPQPFSPLSSPLTSSPIPAQLSYPSPAPTPKVKPGTPHASLPRRHRPTRPSRPARYLPRSPAPPFPHSSPIQALLPPKRSPTRPALPHHAGADTHKPATQPAIFPVTSSPIPAHLSSPSDPYKNPGSRPPPGFLVISGSVRFPSQRRLR